MRAIIILLAGLPLGVALLPSTVRAETHGSTVMNRSGDTLRSIQIAPAGATSYGVNRLRSQLPPGAEARISYSAGCPVDLRLGFDGGRVEDRRDLDACAQPTRPDWERHAKGSQHRTGPYLNRQAQGRYDARRGCAAAAVDRA